MTDRSRLIEELSELVQSRAALEIYLEQDDRALARTVARHRAIADRIRRDGHIASSGLGLRPVE